MEEQPIQEGRRQTDRKIRKAPKLHPAAVIHRKEKGYKISSKSPTIAWHKTFIFLVTFLFCLIFLCGSILAFIGWLKFVALGTTRNYEYWYAWRDNLLQIHTFQAWENFRIFLKELYR